MNGTDPADLGEELPSDEAMVLLLSAMRVWRIGRATGIPCSDTLAALLDHAGALSAGPALDGLMVWLDAAGPGLRFARPGDDDATDDERRLVQALSLAQRGFGEAAGGLLLPMAGPGSLLPVLVQLEALADSLEACGIRVSEAEEADSLALPAAEPAWRDAASRLH